MSAVPVATANPEYQGGWRRLAILVRRELWEHRELLWVPVVIGLLHLGLALAALVLPQHLHGNIEFVQASDGDLFEDSSDPGRKPAPTTVTRRVDWETMNLSGLLMVASHTPVAERGEFLREVSMGHARVTLAIGGFLLLILLGRMQSREQQTRSSLFFQSMPLGPWEYLGAKLLTAVPLGLALLWLTIVLSQLVWLLVFSAAAWAHGHSALDLFWRPAQFPAGWSVLAAQMVVDTLWYLPGIGWTLLLGSLGVNARRGQRNGMWIGAGLFAAVMVDRLYLTGGGLMAWLLHHLLPVGFSWSWRGLESTSAWLGAPAGRGGPLDLWSGVLLGLLMMAAAVKVLHWREER
ncbi:MAG: hypothetical protein WC326_08690 [Candidatus Delongbacteria bacterium]